MLRLTLAAGAAAVAALLTERRKRPMPASGTAQR
jgi:hypothetical protein